MKARRSPNWTVLFVVLLVLVLGIAGAVYKFMLKKELSEESLVGHYKLHYGYGVSKLELRADGTYRHEYSGTTGRSKGVEEVSNGKWTIKPHGDGKIRIVFSPWHQFTEESINLDPRGTKTESQPMIPYARALGEIEILYTTRQDKSDLIFMSVKP